MVPYIILTEGNIDAVTIANNHAKDFGSNGLKRTKSVLEKANIAICGYDSYAILDVKGTKVGLLGYTVWDNDYEQMRKDIYGTHVRFDPTYEAQCDRLSCLQRFLSSSGSAPLPAGSVCHRRVP
jgi:predicted transcriptional regulator